MWQIGVTFVSGRVRVSGQVEPKACPAFSMPGIFQEAINDGLVGSGRFVGEERLPFCRCWREANEIEIDASQQGFF